MKTTRRRLLGRLGLGAAAVAVAGVVEPVKAAQTVDTTVRSAYEQGRADGYNRGREVEAARQEARAKPIDALTIESLQEACAARGCALETHYSVERLMYVAEHLPTASAQWAEGIMLIEKQDTVAVSAWLDRLHG